MNIGDIVFPAHDDKAIRATRCIVTDVRGDNISVRGTFWGHEDERVVIFVGDIQTGYYTYLNGNFWSDEQYYRLYSLEEMKEMIPFFDEAYIEELGLKNT